MVSSIQYMYRGDEVLCVWILYEDPEYHSYFMYFTHTPCLNFNCWLHCIYCLVFFRLCKYFSCHHVWDWVVMDGKWDRTIVDLIICYFLSYIVVVIRQTIYAAVLLVSELSLSVLYFTLDFSGLNVWLHVRWSFNICFIQLLMCEKFS